MKTMGLLQKAAFGSFAFFLVTTGPATAGGFSYSSGPVVSAQGSAQGSTKIKSGYLDFDSNTFAKTGVRISHQGKIAEGYAVSGNTTTYGAYGNSSYTQTNDAKSKLYAKAGSIVAKSRSTTCTTIYVDGHAYVVSKEVARAMTRFTPLGTTASADSKTSVSVTGSGYLGVTTGTTNRAYIRVAQ